MTAESKAYKPGPVATTYVTKNEYLALILEDLMDMGFRDISFKDHVFSAISKYDSVNRVLYGTSGRAETYNYYNTTGLLIRVAHTNHGRHHNWKLSDAVATIESCLSSGRKSVRFSYARECPAKYSFLSRPWERGFVLFESPEFPMQRAYLLMQQKKHAVTEDEKGNEILRGKIRGLQVDLQIAEKRLEENKNSLLRMQDSFIRNYPDVTPEQIAEWRIS